MLYIFYNDVLFFNFSNKAIMNFIICTPSPIYYKLVATTEEKHTGDYTSQQVESVITEIEIKKFIAVITGNTSTMLKATKILTTKYPYITLEGCAAHVLNLFIGNIFKVNSILLAKTEANNIVEQIIGLIMYKQSLQNYKNKKM